MSCESKNGVIFTPTAENGTFCSPDVNLFSVFMSELRKLEV